MKRKLLTFIVFLCTFFVQQNVNAQTTLAAGDIAFIGYQTAGSDGFSFITLKAMNTGTLLYLTEKGWGNGTWISGSTEPHLLWTVPAFTPAGTIVSIVETATADTFTVTGTTPASITFALGTSFNLSGGDQMLAYQSSTGPQPASPTFIAGVHADYNLSDYDTTTKWNTTGATGGNSSSLPPGLTNGVNCVSLFPGVAEVANSKYTGTLTGTVSALLASINNYANWSHNATTDLGITPSGYATPAVSTVVVATVSTATASSVKSVSAIMGGTLSADGGDPSVQKGIVWATTAAPTISNNKVQNGTGTGAFSATITGLPSGSTIHYRAYATNTAGTSYGTELTFNTSAGLSTSSTTQTDINCNGGNNGIATVAVTGGTVPYSYSWSPSGGTGATASSLVAGTYTVTITDGEATQITRSFNIIQPSVLNGTSSTTAVSCFGGSNGTATITPTGGAGGYTYLWSNGATTATASGLLAGTYGVTITDANGCPKTISGITVGGPTAALSGTASTTPVSCFGGNNGTATAVAIGGTGAKTYLWSNGATTATATSLIAGTYSVTITDANGCPFPVTGIIVGQPSTAVSGTISKTDVTCNGGTNGSATVTPTGGTPGYTYSWSPAGGTAATATGLVAGTYTVTITDANSCQTTETVTITQPGELIATPVAQTNIGCHGDATGSATVNVTGGTGAYTYSWAPSGGTGATASGLTAGTYTVTVTDENGCFATQSFTINGPSAALSATTASTGVSCFSGSNGTASVIVSGGTPSYTYLWAPLGGTTSSITGRPAGNYTCTITDANGCTLVKNITISTPSLVAITTSKTDVSCNGGSNGSASVTASGGTPGYTYSWAPSGGTAASASGLSAGTYTVTVTDANTCSYTADVTINEPSVLTATTALTNLLCNGQANGTASVIVSGGTPGYTYLWSPSGGTASTATGLAAGNYSCLITDAKGCFITKNFTINQPAVLSATTSQVNATCNTAGQAGVTVSGGTAPYNYSWAPSGGTGAIATGLLAGNYSCFISDANGCTLSKNFIITTTNTLVAAASQTNILCNGSNTGSASVVPSGAPGPFTYVWAPSGGNAATASNLTAGNYSVTITATNGCSIVKNFTITQPSALLVTPSQTNILCNGTATGSASVSVTGGTGTYSYAWAPSGGTAATAIGLTAGNYTITVTDANLCQTTQSFTITEPDALTATIAPTNVSCNGGTNGSATVTTTGGTGAYTYVWAPSGGTAATATGLTAGTYTVTVTDANSCTTTQSVTITEPSLLTASIGGQTDVSCNGLNNGSATVNATGGTYTYTYAWAPSGGTGDTATGLSPGTYTVTVTDANSCTATQTFTITEPAVLAASITGQTYVTCNGQADGSATVTATGGTGTYTYSWAPTGGTDATATGLAAGTYTVTVTDANSCTTTQNVTITEPNALTATIAPTNVSCNGGTTGAATVTATGGTGTYSYTWAPSGGTDATATGLAAGTYTVTVTDAKSCTTTQSVTITEPNTLTTTIAPTNVSCNGGTTGAATVTATGGTGTYSYLWSPTGGTAATATGLTAGTYTVTVTDANSCTTTQSVTITEPSLLAASSGGQTDVTCNGFNDGSATVTATGGTGTYTYAWSPSGGTAETATGLSPGIYTVTVTDTNSCTANQSFTITEPAVLAASITGQTDVTCNGQADGSATVTATGGTGTYTYSWAPTGGTDATATGLAAGTYTVTVTDANSCTTTQSVTITEPNALTATIAPTNVSCNGGTNGAATVTTTGGTGAYTYVWAPTGGTDATATGLAAGTYTVTVTDANSCTTTQNVTITEPSLLVASVGGQTDVTCNGLNNGSATVTATGGTGAYTYSWSPAGGTAATATGISAGTYTVIVTDANSCTATQSFTITEPAVLAASITGQTDVTCNGQADGSATITATGGTGAYTYAWAPSGGTDATATGLAAGTYTVTVTDANSCTTTQNVTITEPNTLTATIAPTNVSCNGGTNGAATVTATGGTGAYTYAWTPSGGTAATATGLTAGTYTVTVKDAHSCTATQSVTITEPSLLTASIGGQTDVSCNGLNDGSATVTATGGTGSYTYAWSPAGGTAETAAGLSPGTYTVTVTDANSCTANQSFTITEPAVLAASITDQTDVTCNGQADGSATVTATGGTGTYIYEWAPSGGTDATATGLAAGTYTVTVTDANSCTTTQSVTITEPNALTATIAPTNVSCNGGTTGAATVTATGGTGTYSYTWAPMGGTAATATGLTAGTYTVTVTDVNSCAITQSVTITEPSLLTASIGSQTDVSCKGLNDGSATVTATGGTGSYTYAWSPAGGAAATATGLTTGTYTVTVTDANSCSATQVFNITEPTLLTSNIASQTNVSCNGLSDGSAIITVTGGVAPYNFLWSNGSTTKDISGLASGIYTLTITDANNCSATQSVTISTIPDVTPPVPTVANLPEITNYCSVLAAQIPIPTATDNCAGIINATTTSPLNYTTDGSYVITWSFNDGSGNISTQNQTVKVLNSLIDQVTFNNTEFTFDSNEHIIQVANLPAGASVVYSTVPATGTNNGATNAGIYAVTATVTPSAATPNCSPVILNANLTIKKAAQQITFGALAPRILGGNNDFNLQAVSNSGLPIRFSFTYTSALPPADVSPSGVVSMLRSGELLITAHQDGDENYLPAASVSQLLIIKNNDIAVQSITIGTKVYNSPPKDISYLMSCGENNPNVAILNQTNATIIPGANFSIATPKPGIYTQNVTITSQDGTATATYTIKVEKPFAFYDIVKQKFNNILLVNNNPLTNGGYVFVSFQWFKNGQLVGTGPYYSAGNDSNFTLDPLATYSVKMTTLDGKVLKTCDTNIVLQNSLQAKLYPNPIEVGKVITVEADFPQEELQNMQITLYSVAGKLIKTVQSSSVITEIQLPETTESNMYLVVLETSNIKKSFKVIVK